MNDTKTAAVAASETEAPLRATDSQPETGQLGFLREAVFALSEKAKTANVSELSAAVEKIAGAVKLEADLERSKTELEKLAGEVTKLTYENDSASKRESSERTKEYISILTPLVTVAVLAGTLIAQNWQFLRSEKDKRDDAVEARWQDTVKSLSTSGKLSPSVIALQPFLDAPAYRERAQEVTVQLLGSGSPDDDLFQTLFRAAFVPLNQGGLSQVLRLDKTLLSRAIPLWAKSWIEATHTNDLRGLDDAEKKLFSYVDNGIAQLTAQVGTLIKGSGQKLSNSDLSGAYFEKGDWRGVNLSGDDLENTRLENMNLSGANLSRITQFANLYLLRTAWWEAASISPELLEYLKANYPCDPMNDYGYGLNGIKCTKVQYDKEIGRLSLRPATS